MKAVTMKHPLPPALTNEQPAPGKRVKMVAPDYAGTEVYHSLYLPDGWQPGERYPVIVEYTGNKHAVSGSTGEVKDACLGFAIARELPALWVVMPYVSADGQASMHTWWGSQERTTAYCLANLQHICQDWGGNPDELFLCGFSRGAIGINYLGLHDDEVASVWLGFYSHDHYDGVREWRGTDWGAPLTHYRREAAARLARMQGRAALISQCGTTQSIEAYLRDNQLEQAGQFTFLSVSMGELFPDIPNEVMVHSHTDRWLLFDSPMQATVIQWFRDTIRDKPGR